MINIREILFRGKRIDNGEWVEGCYTFSKKASRHIIWVQSESNAEFWHTYPIAVDPLSVGQFTGLTDKNGKKIFEGDIVFAGYGEYYQGQHEHSATMIIDMADYEALNALCNANVVEVIGNIHDNPELAKEGAE